MEKNRRDFLKLAGMAGLSAANAEMAQASAPLAHGGNRRHPEAPAASAIAVSSERKTFVAAGRPLAVMGSAPKDMHQEGNELVLPPDEMTVSRSHAALDSSV